MKHIVSFPGFGINEFTLDSVAFELFGKPIAWYGIIITLGIIVAVTTIYLYLKKRGLIFDDMIDVAFCTVLPGIAGARLYYVFFDWQENPDHYTSFMDVIAIWEGGLAIYGGIIFGALGCILALRWKKIHIPAFFDILGPSVQLAQAIGRWGNFMNAEAFGSQTSLPWRMRLECTDHYCSKIPFSGPIEVHPTFLYESIWNLIGFAVAMLYSKKKKFDGEVCLIYIAWYGLGRALIEGLRTDSLHIGSSDIRISQLFAALCFVAAVAVLIYLHFIKKYRYRSDCIYLSTSKHYKAADLAAEDEGVTKEAQAEQADENTENIADTPDGGDNSQENQEDN